MPWNGEASTFRRSSGSLAGGSRCCRCSGGAPAGGGGAPGRARCSCVEAAADGTAAAAMPGGTGGNSAAADAGAAGAALEGRGLFGAGSSAAGRLGASSPHAWHSHSHASYLCSMRHQHGDNLEVRIPAERRPLESLVCAPGLGSLYWIGTDGIRCKHYSSTRSTIDTRCTRTRNDARAHQQFIRQLGGHRQRSAGGMDLLGQSLCQLFGHEELGRTRIPSRY